MDKARAVDLSLELTKTLLATMNLEIIPHRELAEDLADFIEALAARLEKLDGHNN